MNFFKKTLSSFCLVTFLSPVLWVTFGCATDNITTEPSKTDKSVVARDDVVSNVFKVNRNNALLNAQKAVVRSLDDGHATQVKADFSDEENTNDTRQIDR